MAERVFSVVEVLALALWVGALAGFAFVFAPAAFHVEADLARFATLVAATLRALSVYGLFCGVVAVIAALVRMRSEAQRSPSIVRIALVAAMLLLNWYETGKIIPQMEATAASFHGDFAATPKSDPRRRRYDAIHRASSAVYGTILLLGCISIAIAFVRTEQNQPWYARR